MSIDINDLSVKHKKKRLTYSVLFILDTENLTIAVTGKILVY